MYRRTGMRRPLPVLPVAAGCRCNDNPSRIASPRPGGGFCSCAAGGSPDFVPLRPCFRGLGCCGAVRADRPAVHAGHFRRRQRAQTTVVPVQQPPVQVVEHTTVYEESMRSMTRPERRAYRAKLYAQKIDSLVQSRDYMFFPNSMQEVPGGMIRSIYTDYYFFGMFIDHVGVHLPTERGITQYLYVLNFDSPSLSGYRAERLAWGWLHLLRFCRRRYALPCRLRGFDRHRRDGADADGSRPCHALCRVALGQTDRRSQVPATGLSGGFH